MDEIKDVIRKYDEEYIRDGLATAADVTCFATVFYNDVADIYDAITRVRNIQRNPAGFSLEDAPILGLLIRSWKLLKEVIRYYEENNAEILGVLERPLLEAVITARFLIQSDLSVVEDYRKCSYKDRLRILREFKEGSLFFETKPGQRLLSSVLEKMEFENLTESDFSTQRQNRWRLQGKTFFEIFGTVERREYYTYTYGMMSESIHGSWNDSLDFSLIRNPDGTFKAYPFSQPTDIRYVTPMLGFCNPAYRLWLKRIEGYDDNLAAVLDWIDRVNRALYSKFDAVQDETDHQDPTA